MQYVERDFQEIVYVADANVVHLAVHVRKAAEIN